MADNNHKWVDYIRKLPGWITGFIAFITGVVGLVKLWQGDTGLVTIVLVVIGVGGAWLACLHLALKRTTPLVEGGKGTWQYPRWRRWALAGVVAIPLLTAGIVRYYFYQQAQPPSKVILLVANFDGPDPQEYRVTETVLRHLRNALSGYDDVGVEALGQEITEAEGSAVARTEGDKRKAAIVIWGWYGVTEEAVPLSVHFELLRPPRYMPELGPEAKGEVRVMPVAELQSFALQTNLSAEMAYLTLFTVGMARYAAWDLDGAISRLEDALSQPASPVQALDRSVVHLYCGHAHYAKGDTGEAIDNYDQAIALSPGLARAYLARGWALARTGREEQAIADFKEVLVLSSDPPLREVAQVELLMLGAW